MIEIINLSKSFGDNKVLDNLNLVINSGEAMVIIGRSGCGKSVLLKHIIGLLRSDFGQVLIDNSDITKIDYKKLDELRLSFGMLFQGAALFDSMTVDENVGFALREHTDLKEDLVREKVARALEMVGLKGIEDLMPAELSGGMKKRVGLARAICNNPKIILYDEPTTGVDPVMADAVNELIIDLNHKLKVTSIVVTHDMVSAYKIATRIAMLYKGKIIAVGTPEEIKNSQDPIVRQFITGASKGPITENGG
ncbi:MAG: ABC transporter ATP-binding protein [Candidatus Omnitrophica bacterium]|nr:ABC transporter ATP-binding protein [Candidatus Omnitrophota bacterium]MBU4149192.1 ABC transporter ATP-binding protein [Candidatus Omnitrophota bacterium]